MSDIEFPTPDGLEVAEDDKRPGEPLHPGEHTIVDGDNNALAQGEVIQVWFKAYADGHGTETITGKLQVIGDDGDGDIFAVPADQDAEEISRVYRLAGDLSTITHGYVVPVPEYDEEEGILTTTRHVQRRGSQENQLLEVRTHGREQFWSISGVDL